MRDAFTADKHPHTDYVHTDISAAALAHTACSLPRDAAACGHCTV
jgi:hypothetical protein